MSEEEKEIEVVDEAIETEQPEVEEAPEQEVEQVAEVKKPTKYQKRIDELTHRQRELNQNHKTQVPAETYNEQSVVLIFLMGLPVRNYGKSKELFLMTHRL